MTTENSELLPNQIILFGEVRTLHPLQGRKARLMFPKVLDLIGGFLGAVRASQIDLTKLLSGQVGLEDMAVVLMTLGRFLTSEQWKNFDEEIVPFLLEEEPHPDPSGIMVDRLAHEGDIIEVYAALWRAIQYHVTTSLDKPQVQALMKLFQEGQRRKNSEEPAAQS